MESIKELYKCSLCSQTVLDKMTAPDDLYFWTGRTWSTEHPDSNQRARGEPADSYV